MEANQGMTGRRDERAESRQELERCHDAVSPFAARSLDAVGDPPVGQCSKSLEAQRCPGAVAQESLSALAVGLALLGLGASRERNPVAGFGARLAELR